MFAHILAYFNLILLLWQTCPGVCQVLYYTCKGQKGHKAGQAPFWAPTQTGPLLVCAYSHHKSACRLLQASEASLQPKHQETSPVKTHVAFAVTTRMGK